MTVTGFIENRIEIPQGVTVKIDGRNLAVKGPKGELSRHFAHPRVKTVLDGNEVVISCEYPRVKEKAMTGTYVAHMNNMIRGVTEGYVYHMKIVFNHFPMKVAVKGKTVQIDNYQGGKAPRFADIVNNCAVKVSGADLTISGPDIEACGQTAANIEKATSRRGFDTRGFQDGIYIVEKSHKVRQ